MSMEKTMIGYSEQSLRALSMFGLTTRDVEDSRRERRRQSARTRRLAERVDRVLAPGGIAVVLGPSGAGKTRLLRSLARVLAARGQRAAWAKPARAGRTRVIEAVCNPAEGDDADQIVRRGLSRLAACGLADARLMVAPARQLSQGELARLSLAVALARRREGEPITLLIDEFAAALDDDTAIGVASGLARVVARDPALRVVLATHRRVCVEALRPSVRVRL
jgi:ABC-type ATPase with predicted acetyltransferase domain